MIESIDILCFNKKRRIQVYLPEKYHTDAKRYPVLYMHDGQNVFENKEAFGGIALELHQYLDQKKIEIIVVAIDRNTNDAERINEYCPWSNGAFSQKFIGSQNTTGGKGKAYVNFIIQELKPLIDQTYRTIQNQTYMAGISLGGLISTFAACCYPQVFTQIAAISPAFYRNQEEIEFLLCKSNLSHIKKFYLDYGTRESGKKDKISKLFIQSNETIFKILKDKKVNVQLNLLKDAEHNYVAFKERVPTFISFLTDNSNRI